MMLIQMVNRLNYGILSKKLAEWKPFLEKCCVKRFDSFSSNLFPQLHLKLTFSRPVGSLPAGDVEAPAHDEEADPDAELMVRFLFSL
jgi:hypothetical protein